MAGERELKTLLASIQPVLHEQEYVFITLTAQAAKSVVDLAPLGTFLEPEGLTAIVLKATADRANIDYQGVFCCITLTVHSSLEAVGLTAAVSTALSEQNISANVVAAFYHDHIFVPQADAKDALLCLQNVALSNQ